MVVRLEDVSLKRSRMWHYVCETDDHSQDYSCFLLYTIIPHKMTSGLYTCSNYTEHTSYRVRQAFSSGDLYLYFIIQLHDAHFAHVYYYQNNTGSCNDERILMLINLSPTIKCHEVQVSVLVHNSIAWRQQYNLNVGN